jgi:hypothetical protein
MVHHQYNHKSRVKKIQSSVPSDKILVGGLFSEVCSPHSILTVFQSLVAERKWLTTSNKVECHNQ